MIRVGIVGASSLAGGELIRLVFQHPELELTFLGGSANVGRRPVELHPELRLELGLTVEPVTDLTGRCDVVFLATPAPVSAQLAPKLADQVPCVIDLSGAFRIREPALHGQWYPQTERHADLVDRFVYGVPELVGEQLIDAPLISLPGCYATAITLGLAPLMSLGPDLRTVLVDGKSGASGTGRNLPRGAITPYAPVGHPHAAETTEFFERTAPGKIGSLMMSAYGVAHVRGLLASSYVLSDTIMDPDELHRSYLRFYRNHRFIRVRSNDETLSAVPDPQAVLGSNFCDITVMGDPHSERIVVLVALDDMVKGAAGQGIQALNRRFCLSEETGLTMQPMRPA